MLGEKVESLGRKSAISLVTLLRYNLAGDGQAIRRKGLEQSADCGEGWGGQGWDGGHRSVLKRCGVIQTPRVRPARSCDPILLAPGWSRELIYAVIASKARSVYA